MLIASTFPRLTFLTRGSCRVGPLSPKTFGVVSLLLLVILPYPPHISAYLSSSPHHLAAFPSSHFESAHVALARTLLYEDLLIIFTCALTCTFLQTAIPRRTPRNSLSHIMQQQRITFSKPARCQSGASLRTAATLSNGECRRFISSPSLLRTFSDVLRASHQHSAQGFVLTDTASCRVQRHHDGLSVARSLTIVSSHQESTPLMLSRSGTEAV